MKDPIQWKPSASLANLHQRADIIRKIRQFFERRNFLEVETPLLASAAICDPNLHSFSTQFMAPHQQAGSLYYLQTSPEFHMKRLLAAGSGPIFQITKAFRNGEQGRKHQPEFTMLEWYRPGFNDHHLMDEISELLINVFGFKKAERICYADIFKKTLKIDPLEASNEDLRACTVINGIGEVVGLDINDRDGWLDILMTHCIEPTLGKTAPIFIYDYPASQAALARIKPNNSKVAERFELYINGLELANGFHELTDATLQRIRFEEELLQRAKMGLTSVPIDHYLLTALEAGLPPCAGVAVGLDRLCMIAMNAKSIQDVVSFSWANT